MSCVCDLTKEKTECLCQSLITGKSTANEPVDLMRSRYVAFATGKVDYLYATSSKALQQQLTINELKESCDNTQFIGLEIIEHNDDWVEFKADYLVDDILSCIHETSQFIKEGATWKYDNGVLHPSEQIKVKRNDLCPCGSNKKFKKCHQK